MRRVRVIVCMLFVISCAVCGIYLVKTHMVEDHTPPTITCEEESIEVSVSAEDSELLKGVKAKDNKDGNITKSVTISSMSHFIEKGKRTITYIVFDKANQAGTAQRTLIYTDYTPPKIHLTKPLRYTSNQMGSVNLVENVTAEDCLDGDLTNQVRVSMGDSYYSSDPGSYPITLLVNNSAGDVCSVPVNVEVTDSTDRYETSKTYPMLTEYIAYAKVGGAVDAGAFLSGVVKGNSELTFAEDGAYIGFGPESIFIQSNVDYSQPGVGTIDYSYTNEDGVTAVTKLYVVVEE